MVRAYKKRYILFRLISEENQLTKNKVRKAIYGCSQHLFGIFGLSQANLDFLEYDEEKKLGILRCSNKSLDNIRASLAFIQQLEGERVSLHVLRVSGTIKTIKNAIRSEKSLEV